MSNSSTFAVISNLHMIIETDIHMQNKSYHFSLGRKTTRWQLIQNTIYDYLVFDLGIKSNTNKINNYFVSYDLHQQGVDTWIIYL